MPTLAPHTRLGPYEILDPIGAGGMGEVYRARDTRLDRTVALKILPLQLASQPEARERFEREARAVSSLNHPHICILYDIGSQDGLDYLVMEYLEGETLAARLARGPLPPDQVQLYAIQIADALSQAHRQGVQHRDLKPGNIMLTKAGAKLLDFGLARMGVGSRVMGVGDPTLSQNLTQKGTILGTLQYMPPEQLEGRDTDPRSDIFSFGAVLYEMAAGRKAFEGKGHASLIAAIMDTEPPPLDHPQLNHVVQRCLAKDPDNRWQTARDVLLELKSLGEQSEPIPPTPKTHPPTPRTAAAAVLAAAVLALLAFLYFRPAPVEPPAVTRFFISPPEKTTFAAFGPLLSPDGSRLAAVVVSSDGNTRLWVRPLDSLTGQFLAGTERVTYCFWSPDSRFLGFFAEGKLKKVDIAGGPPQTLCDALSGQGAAWGADGVILFTPNIRDPLYRISAAGGTPAPLTSLDLARQEGTHRWPHFLPDGRHFLYLARSTTPPGNTAIYLASLDGKERKLLVSATSSAGYSPPRGAKEGHVLFTRDGALLALPVLPDRMEPAGEPFPVAEQVEFTQLTSRSAFSVSHNGVLAYLTGSGIREQRQLVWLDRSGKQVATAGAPGPYTDLRLSPDQRRAAVSRLDPQTGSRDIWIFEFARGITSRFTFHPANDAYPVWSPDGSRIIWGATRDAALNLYHKVSSGDGAEEMLFQSGFPKYPWDWSPDGRFVVYSSLEGTGRTGRDLWALPLSGERKPLLIVKSEFLKDQAKFSPDGRWIAYVSNESGANQVYVQRFVAGSGAETSGSAGRWQVSIDGGVQPRWRRDGRELYYLASDRKLMAVEVKSSTTFEAGAPRALFSAPVGLVAAFGYSYYDVTADGQRFLVNALLEEAPATPITVVLNWTAGVKR